MTTTTEKDVARVHTRWMIRRNMPSVLEIERLSYDNGWTEDEFLRLLRRRNHIGMVAEIDETVVGFMIYRLDTHGIELLNLAVHPDYRRRWVGVQMVAKLVGKLSSHRRTEIVVDVRETNLVAQQFFRDRGFLAVNVRRDVYEDSGEDCYEFSYTIDED